MLTPLPETTHPDAFDLINMEFDRLRGINADLLKTLQYVKHVTSQHDEWWIGEFINEVNAAIEKTTLL